MTDNRIFALVGRWDGSQDPHAVRVIAVTPSCPPPILKARPADRWTIEDFILVRKLGQGYASSVYLAVCKFSKESVIIKITKKAGLSMLNDYQIRREIAIHSRLQHVNLCALHAAFEDNEAYYAIQEHCAGGDLFQKMQQRRTVFTEKECVAKILLPLLKSLYYMHSRGVIHRDIKPENILLSARDEVKLGDFGLSIAYLDERPVTRLGTTEYMAPEILLCHTKDQPMEHKNGMEFYGSSADVWAVGVLTYELLVGSLPFQGKDRYQISRSIMTDQPKYPSWLSPGAQDFVAKSLSKLPSMRPSMKDLLRHPWISAYAQLVPNASKPQLQTTKSMGGSVGVERSTASVSYLAPGSTKVDPEEGMHDIERQQPRAAKVGAPSFTSKGPAAQAARMEMLKQLQAEGLSVGPKSQGPAVAGPSDDASAAAPATSAKAAAPAGAAGEKEGPTKSEGHGVMVSAQSFSVHALQMNRLLAQEIMDGNKSLLETNEANAKTKADKAADKAAGIVPQTSKSGTPGQILTSKAGVRASTSSAGGSASQKKTVSFAQVDAGAAAAAQRPQAVVPSGGRHAMAAATSFVFPNNYHPSIEFDIDEDDEEEGGSQPKAGGQGSNAVHRSSANDTASTPKFVTTNTNPIIAGPREDKKKGPFSRLFSWKKKKDDEE